MRWIQAKRVVPELFNDVFNKKAKKHKQRTDLTILELVTESNPPRQGVGAGVTGQFTAKTITETG